jgi:hypothetical protein
MGLDIRGITIYSLGEWHTLARSYSDPAASAPLVLTAWSMGELVEPREIGLALDFEARFIPGASKQTHELIDLGLRRLVAAFPQELG